MTLERIRVGKPCCGCVSNLNVPEVKFIACIAGRSIEVVCECQCHAASKDPQ